jgi:hypothetical protein
MKGADDLHEQLWHVLRPRLRGGGFDDMQLVVGLLLAEAVAIAYAFARSAIDAETGAPCPLDRTTFLAMAGAAWDAVARTTTKELS